MEGLTCPYNCRNGRIFNTVLKQYQPCPHCASALSELTKATPTDSSINLLDELSIPNQYRNVKFNPATFFEPMTYKVYAKSTCEPVLEQLSAIESAILSSNILLESCYFYTGLYSLSLEYVYSCLIEAVRHGLTAVPYVSLKDLQGIRNNTEQLAHLYTSLTWYDFTSCDICFVAATASSDNAEAILLAELLQERARRGLPTYVMGYWAQSALEKSKNSLAYLIDKDSKRLSLLKPYELTTLYRYNSNDSLATVGSLGDLGVEQPRFYRTSAGGLGVSVEKYKSTNQ